MPDKKDLSRAMSGFSENTLGEIKASKSAAAQKELWIDLILSKEFVAKVDEVFDRCNINKDATLGKSELAAAMEMLYLALDEHVGGEGNLPKVKASVDEIIRKYDSNHDGVLDRDEFRGFAQTYFSRVELPRWRIAAKGAMKGAVLFIAWHGLIEPLANKLLMPHVLGAVKKSVTSGVLNEMRKKRKEARRAIKKKIYHGVAPGADDDTNLPSDVANELEYEKFLNRCKVCKELGTFAVSGGVAAVAGFL